MQWMPHTTVAAIVEDNGKFLLVEEVTERGNRLNQPAGHLENNETLIEAVIRETLEETAYTFKPESLLGIYHWKHEHNDTTYLRFAYIGSVSNHQADLALDEGIIRAVWMTADEMRSNAMLMRSPQVLTCVEDYLSGQQFPLSVITHL
jgi:8-oxo-dGTP pyrophosphatase MutT (NUDIX family)